MSQSASACDDRETPVDEWVTQSAPSHDSHATGRDRRNRTVLWIAPNLNSYKARFLDYLCSNGGLDLVVVAGAPLHEEGHSYAALDHRFQQVNFPVNKRQFAFRPGTYWRFLKLVAGNRFNMVVMPIEKKHLPLILFLLLLRCVYRYRLVSYNHPSLRSKNGVVTRRDTVLSRLLFRCYDHIVFYTEASRRWAIERGLITPQKASAANNTLDTERIWSEYTFEINGTEPKTLLFIGRLIPDKRLDLLFEYFDRLVEQIPALQLKIIGDGPEADLVRREAQVRSNVTWLGAIVEESEIAHQMRSSHAVFIPGHSGLSIVHAFSYGKPYITFCVDEIFHAPEIDYLIDDHNGLKLDLDSRKSTDRIVEALTDKARYTDLCTRAYATAQRLSIQNWCRDMSAALDTACPAAVNSPTQMLDSHTPDQTSNRPRVAFIGALPPPAMGPTLATEMLLSSELKNHFDLLHIDTSDPRPIDTLARFDFTNIYLGIKSYFVLMVVILRYWPSIVYVPISQTTIGYLRDSVYILMSKLFCRRVVCHLRGGEFKDWLARCPVLLRWYVHRVHRLIDAQIVLGTNLRHLFQDILDEDRIFVVPNGKDISLPTVAASDDREEVVVLYLANIIRTKGVMDVLEATKIVSRTSSANIRVRIAGAWTDQEFRREVEEFLAQHPDLPIEWLGPQHGEEKLRCFVTADIFTFPTYYPPEGHPWVVVEAMAAGLPIISTDQGAITESVIDGQNGRIIRKNDPRALADAILELVDSPEQMKQMGTASARLYHSKFREKNVVANLTHVFNQVAALN